MFQKHWMALLNVVQICFCCDVDDELNTVSDASKLHHVDVGL